jgi:fructose-bisphosphate aldolase class II
MSLVNMKDLLADARAGGYAVGAFNVADMEMILGVVGAAEQLRSPVILQIAEVRLPYSPLHLIGPMMVAAAKAASVPVAVHFDHGLTLERIGEALALGFTSVMVDGSKYPLERNIGLTLAAKKLADARGAALEAEIGVVGGSEGASGRAQADSRMVTDPVEAARFYEAARPDALAVAIGNAHGFYKAVPKLDIPLLRRLGAEIPVPLVLHGGTGIGEEGFRECIRSGIRKINVATAGFSAAEKGAEAYYASLADRTQGQYFTLSAAMADGVRENTARHMRIFGSPGRA